MRQPGIIQFATCSTETDSQPLDNSEEDGSKKGWGEKYKHFSVRILSWLVTMWTRQENI